MGDGQSRPPAYFLIGGKKNMIESKYIDEGTDEAFYDPVRQDIRTVDFVKKFYGKAVLKQLAEETNHARYEQIETPDEAFSQELKDKIQKALIRSFPGCGFEEKKPLTGAAIKAYQDHIGFAEKKAEEADNSQDKNLKKLKTRQKGDDFFWMLERGLIRNPEFRRMFKSNFSLYLWLWANIVREGWIDKKGYPIKAKYYDRGYLAYCSSYSKLAKDCFMDKDTVKKYIDEFAKDHTIRLDFIVPEGKKQKQGVYILGEWKKVGGQISERLYLEHEFLEPKRDSPWFFKAEN